MKGFKGSTLGIFLLLFATIFFTPLPVFGDATVSIQPPAFSLGVGSSFDVFVGISGVTDLYAFQFDLSFDPAILSAASVSEGPFLPGGGSTLFLPGTIDNSGGTISFTADAFLGPGPGVSGSGTLADISFQALGPGTSLIDLSNVILLDSNLGEIAEFTTTSGSVTVPEPSTILLISMGMVALGMVRKKVPEII
jgi:hypothetical protein